MKILVTGATGVYGRSLVDRLHRNGHDVVAMARRPPRSLPRGVHFAQGDVADPGAVLAAMDGCEVVAHLAFQVSPIKSREESRRISVGGTQNVVDAMLKTGARRLVFTSSAMSYGANPDNPPLFTEEHEQRPSPDYVYGTDKLAAERVIIDSGVEARPHGRDGGAQRRQPAARHPGRPRGNRHQGRRHTLAACPPG